MWLLAKKENKMKSVIIELREGRQADLDGFLLEGRPKEDIKPGDYYVAQRNTGPQLLRAKYVDWENWWVVPDTFAYVYDISECVKVELLA